MSMILRIAWRNIFRNRRRSFVVIGSVAVGVAGGLFILLFMTGLADQMLEAAIHSYVGSLQIHRRGFADNPTVGLSMDAPDSVIAAVRSLDSEIEGYAPRVLSRGLAQSAISSAGVQIVGGRARAESLLTTAPQRLVAGHFLTGTSTPQSREAVIGTELADKLGVHVGNKLVLLAQTREGDMGSGAFRVVGIFRMPSEDLNKSLVWINLQDARQMLELEGALSEVMVMLPQNVELGPIQRRLAARLGSAYEVRSWKDASRQMVQMIDLFDASIYIMMIIIFLAAGLGIVNTMLMSVLERTRELGILRAIGTRPWVLFRMITYEAVLIGLLGIVLGAALIGGACLAGLRHGLDLSIFAQSLALFGSDAVIHPTLRPDQAVITVALVELVTVLASLWPALRASRLRPAEAIRKP